MKDAITSIDLLLKADNTGLDALDTRLKVIENALNTGDDTTGLATRVENIESALKNIIGQFSTMVTDVQLFNIAQPNNTGFNRTLNFVQAAEKANVFPAEANVADKQLKFEEGKYYAGEDSLLIRVSPVDAELTPSSISLLNSQGKELDDIIEDDLRIDTYRSSGAGGQHINKTSSAVRITHIPTGVVVQCQNERSQFQNKDKAMQMLKAKLYMLKQQANAEKLSDIRGDVKDIGWGSQIRSYVLQPYTMVKDHRTGFESGNVNAVLDGGLDGFISAFLKWESLGRPQVKGGQDVE